MEKKRVQSCNQRKKFNKYAKCILSVGFWRKRRFNLVTRERNATNMHNSFFVVDFGEKRGSNLVTVKRNAIDMHNAGQLGLL